MKSFISILLILTLTTLCLFGCSNIPDEPATTAVEQHSYVNPMGQTVPAPENPDPNAPEMPVQYIETVNKIDCVFSSYYVYKNTVATITSIELSDDGFSLNADGYVDIKVDAIGSRSNALRIGYFAYDATGKIVKDSHVLALLDGVKEGDTVEDCRLEFPRETVKIVFFDYIDKD